MIKPKCNQICCKPSIANKKRQNKKTQREPEEEDVHVMRLRGKDGTYTAMGRVYNRHVQKLLAVQIAATLEKIRGTGGCETVVEVIKILYREECKNKFLNRL